MTVESFNPSTEIVSVSPEAVEHFRKQLEANDTAQAVRLSVKESGCTGFKYVVDLGSEPDEQDLRDPLAQDLGVLVDLTSVGVVCGTRREYVTDSDKRHQKVHNAKVEE